ncbi:MAG: hypothetical protein AB7T49_14095 [Oligoflexales bacterium]
MAKKNRDSKLEHEEGDRDEEYSYEYDDEFSGGRFFVSIKDRKKKAREEIERQREQGKVVNPINARAKTITKSFWGKAWCQNLERYEDYAYRLSRGRSYLRNDCVVDLAVEEGRISALVRGSYLYEVSIRVKKIEQEQWVQLVNRCSGRITSLVGLLSGDFPDSVMSAVIERDSGLFPQPTDIKMSCTCLDVADVCKHVAAALYGVGVKFDTMPELFFVLRGANYRDLVKDAARDFVSEAAETASDLDVAEIEELFGIEINTSEPSVDL